MCEWKKIKNATGVLRQSASTWWESLSFSDKPHTWNYMKDLMRENFVNPSLVINSNDEVHQLDQSLIIPPAMPNLLQNNVQKSKDDETENEELNSHMQIQNHHFTMHLLLLLKTQVMPMVLHSRKVKIVLMY